MEPALSIYSILRMDLLEDGKQRAPFMLPFYIMRPDKKTRQKKFAYFFWSFLTFLGSDIAAQWATPIPF